MKLSVIGNVRKNIIVAPRAGAWIETNEIVRGGNLCFGRPPRGGVD